MLKYVMFAVCLGLVVFIVGAQDMNGISTYSHPACPRAIHPSDIPVGSLVAVCWSRAGFPRAGQTFQVLHTLPDSPLMVVKEKGRWSVEPVYSISAPMDDILLQLVPVSYLLAQRSSTNGE